MRLAREEAELEIRPFFEADDFGEAFTPELRAQGDRLRQELEQRQHKVSRPVPRE